MSAGYMGLGALRSHETCLKNTENNGDVYLSTGASRTLGIINSSFMEFTPLVSKPPRRKTKRHLHDQHEFVAILTLSIV